MRSEQRTILVTGASSGIGRAIAGNILAQGHHVIGISRDLGKFTTAMDGFHPVAIDLSKLDELPKKTADLSRQFPALDAVVFAAGQGRFGSLEEFSYQQIQELMNINFISTVFLTRALLPHLKQKARSDLVYIGSEAAIKGSRKGTIYCASKFALRGFTQALREECSTSGLRVCLINPGMVKTPFFDQLSFEPGDDENNFLQPEDVADTVSYVINSRAQTIVDEINLNPVSKVVKKKQV